MADYKVKIEFLLINATDDGAAPLPGSHFGFENKAPDALTAIREAIESVQRANPGYRVSVSRAEAERHDIWKREASKAELQRLALLESILGPVKDEA